MNLLAPDMPTTERLTRPMNLPHTNVAIRRVTEEELSRDPRKPQ